MSNPYRIEGPALISFSGGRSSARSAARSSRAGYLALSRARTLVEERSSERTGKSMPYSPVIERDKAESGVGLHKWERVNPTLERAEVPGGWVYRSTLAVNAMAFVPRS